MIFLAVVFFSYTSGEGGKYAYIHLVSNHKFYWIAENYEEAEPIAQDTIDSYIEQCEEGIFDEQYDLDSYDSIDDFLEEFGNDMKEWVEEDSEGDSNYLSENGEYVITVFVGDKKVYEKVI